MGLVRLSLRDFRCFIAADIRFSSEINLIIGRNASGKTSLLEAIFALGRGRSFRTARLESAVRLGAVGFKLSGKLSTQAGSTTLGLSWENGQSRAVISGKAPESLAQLAETFPLQLVDSQAHQLIRGGPRRRRQFLDWGVFHVEQMFLPVWRRYHRALRQRNVLLRNAKPKTEVSSWNSELSSSGEALNDFRRNYLKDLASTAVIWASQAMGGMRTELNYRQGWPEGQSLAESLSQAASRDREAGMTQYGPHRADLLIKVEGRAAQEHISRGQEKALAGALLLAQAAVYHARTGHACTLLLDDLAAELDAEYLERFMQRVIDTKAQAFITGIDPPKLFREKAARRFHVEQGKIREMV